MYSAPQLSALPPVLSSDNSPRRAAGKETLTEVLFADLGDSTATSPYLIVSRSGLRRKTSNTDTSQLRSSTDDLTLYEPFQISAADSFTTNLRFRKVPGLHLPKYNDDESLEKSGPLRVLSDTGGYATVFMPGASASFVIKTAASLPRIVSLRGKGVRSLCGLNSRNCEAGFTYVDAAGKLREGQLPANARFCANGWIAIKRSPFSADHEIRNIAYHADGDVYAIVTRESISFHPPGDDSRHPAADEGKTWCWFGRNSR